jgi:hypothetical protein
MKKLFPWILVFIPIVSFAQDNAQNQGRLAFRVVMLTVAIIVIVTIVRSRNRKPK